MIMMMVSRVCLVVLLAGCTGMIRADVVENIDMTDYAMAAGVTRNGQLTCNGAKADFRLPDVDIFTHAFVDGRPNGAWVESVTLGSSTVAKCKAYRYPKNNPNMQKSTVIESNYTDCGFNMTTNAELTTYKNVITAVLRSPAPAGIIRRKTYLIPISCIGSSVTNASTLTGATFFPNVETLEEVEEIFDVVVYAKSQQDRRGVFGTLRNTPVYIVTLELDMEDRKLYSILGSKCWATPNNNRDSAVRYEFLQTRGCNKNGADYLKITTTPSESVYEVAHFDFDTALDVEFVYFHCEVNICPNADTSRCSASCSANRKRRNIAAVGTVDRRLSSAPEKRPQGAAKVRIDKDGVPYLKL